jgi:hypothetical protein
LDQPDDPVPTSASDQRVVDDVRKFGWHVVIIREQEGTPGWAFTVGMAKTFGAPEFIVVGLKQRVAHAVLNEIAERIRQGQKFETGVIVEGLLEAATCTIRPVAAKWFKRFVGYAQWFNRDRPFEVRQVIWPDHEGHFPWEPGFCAEWQSRQALLEFEDEGPARCGAILKTMTREDKESA